MTNSLSSVTVEVLVSPLVMFVLLVEFVELDTVGVVVVIVANDDEALVSLLSTLVVVCLVMLFPISCSSSQDPSSPMKTIIFNFLFNLINF